MHERWDKTRETDMGKQVEELFWPPTPTATPAAVEII